MRIKLSGGAKRDIERGIDFYRKIDIDLAVYFNDCISADIDSDNGSPGTTSLD